MGSRIPLSRHAEPRRRGNGGLLVATAIVCAILAACSTTVERVSSTEELKQLAFLQAEAVSRTEVEARLGSPFATYEDGRIVVYVLRKNQNKFETVHIGDPWLQWTGYRLVLVYRSDETLERWSLVDRGHPQ
jgi:hypothetical protein